MPMRREQLKQLTRQLHVLTDFHFQQRYAHDALTNLACEGGADVIQFRQKHGSIRMIFQACRDARIACEQHDALFIVNDRLDLALAVNADGIHVGQTDLPASVVRAVLGPDRIMGVTATTVAQAVNAEQDGADYIGFGPVFATSSKDNPDSVKGLQGLRQAAEAVGIPVIAIAGMTPDRAASAIGHGAHGVAVMSAVTNATDPREATRRFREALERA